jgi:hypothetical protein
LPRKSVSSYASPIRGSEKLASIKHQRYVHAHQFKGANRSLRKLKSYLGRVIPHIGRRIDGDSELEEIFAQPLSFSRRVVAQDQRQLGPKVCSLHAQSYSQHQARFVFEHVRKADSARSIFQE